VSMALLISLGVGTLMAAGIYLTLRARVFDVVLGLTLVSYAVNLFIFFMGRMAVGKEPLVREGVPATLAHYADPLPQALVLTAIVISFGMTAVLLALAVRGHAENGHDHADGPRAREDMDELDEMDAANVAELPDSSDDRRRT
jgi:multicomponent K+:H+ antiporter subunit C